MSYADRVARKRATEKIRSEQDAERVRQRESEGRNDALRHEIRGLIPDVLDRLRDRDYPNVEIAHVAKRHWAFREYPRRGKAAWQIGTYTYDVRQETTEGRLLLLADGRIAASGQGTHVFDLDNPAPFYVTKLGIIRDGLKQLRDALG